MRLFRWLLICVSLILAVILADLCRAQAAPRKPGELVWTIGYDPKTFDPAKVDDQESELVRYLTAGVLLRFNRLSQKVEPRLAESWGLSSDGRTVTFKLRPGLEFSDGSNLTAKDVAWSIRRVLLKDTGAPVAEEFVSPGEVTVDSPDAGTVIVHLPKRVIGIGKVFDEIAIEPADRPSEGRVTAGPFVVAEYRRSQFVRLRANPHYAVADGAALRMRRASVSMSSKTRNRKFVSSNAASTISSRAFRRTISSFSSRKIRPRCAISGPR